jgi:hypothetical protein
MAVKENQKLRTSFLIRFLLQLLLLKELNHIFFIVFYNTEKIGNSRIIKTIPKSDKLVINRVNVVSSSEIDNELLNWITNSRLVAE